MPTMMRPRLVLAALAVGLATCSGSGGAVTSGSTPTVPMLHPSVDSYPAAALQIERSDGEVVPLAVRVADTVARQTHGLMEVEDLPDGTGMLFVYPEDHQRSFWMKNTLVPLDIAFIDEDGQILQILTMEPCEADPCPTYVAEATYRDALEVPAGWFARAGIDVGDRVTGK